MKFYDYLRSQFSNLEQAKEWFYKWYNDWDQNIPDHPEWSGNTCLSKRAMAGHISAVLTGNDNEYDSIYSATKYGSEIFL